MGSENLSEPSGFQFSLVLFCSLLVPHDSGSSWFALLVFPFHFVLFWAFYLWQHGVVWAPALSLTSWSLYMFGIVNPWGETGTIFLCNCRLKTSSREGNDAAQALSEREPCWSIHSIWEGYSPRSVILCGQCLQTSTLLLLCSKAESPWMAISQFKMSCFAWSSVVLWPLVMYKDFSYSIFKQPWSFRSNYQFNGANDHQNKENYTVKSVFLSERESFCIHCGTGHSLSPQHFCNHHSHKRGELGMQRPFYFQCLASSRETFYSIIFSTEWTK